MNRETNESQWYLSGEFTAVQANTSFGLSVTLPECFLRAQHGTESSMLSGNGSYYTAYTFPLDNLSDPNHFFRHIMLKQMVVRAAGMYLSEAKC